MAEALSKHLGLDRFGHNRPLRLGEHELVVRFVVDPSSEEWKVAIVSGWPGAARTTLALHEALGMSVSGKLDKLGGPLGARWKDRMLAELRFIVLPELRFPDLPANAPATAQKTYRCVKHLLRVRRWTEPPEEPVALSAPTLVDWSGGDLTLDEAVAGKRWLDRHGYIVRRGEARGSSGGRPLILWLPMDPATGELTGVLDEHVSDSDPDEDGGGDGDGDLIRF